MRLALAPAALTAVALVCACGGNSTTTSNLAPGQTQQIAGVAELATGAFASAGPGALYDYLAQTVTADCTKPQLSSALAEQEQPTGFKRLETVESDGTRATATLVQEFGDSEKEVQWVFVEERAGVWRIVDLPGLARCVS